MVDSLCYHLHFFLIGTLVFQADAQKDARDLIYSSKQEPRYMWETIIDKLIEALGSWNNFQIDKTRLSKKYKKPKRSFLFICTPFDI